MITLENFNPKPHIPMEKLPLINYSLLLGTLASVQPLDAHIIHLSHQLDNAKEIGTIEKELKEKYQKCADEIKIQLFSLYGS